MPKFIFDKRTCMMVPKSNEEPIIYVMSLMPMKSCWIKLLHNRVNLKSIGNIIYAQVMWFDVHTKTLSEERDSDETISFRDFMLKCNIKPTGWIYVNK